MFTINNKKISQFLPAIICLFIALSVQAQDEKNVSLQPLWKLDLGFQGIGVSTERILGPNTSINLAANVGGGYLIEDADFTYKWDLAEPALSLSINPRWYYNRNKRAEKGKDLALNVGNFIGLKAKYATRGLPENSEVRDAIPLNLHWGWQRRLGRRWIIGSALGAGYAVDTTDLQNSSSSFYPVLDLSFSYVFNYRRLKK